MNQKTLISIGVVLVLAVGGIFLFANNANDEDAESNLAQNTSAQQTDGLPGANLPDGFPTAFNVYSQPFVSEITSTNSADSTETGTVTMTFNSQNLWSIAVSTDQGDQTTIYTGDASYIGSDGQWIKYPTGEGADFDITSYGLTNEDISEAGETATQIGTEPCSLGTCTVWQAVETENGSEAKIWFGPDGRMARMTLVDGTMTVEQNFRYDNVPTIEVPTDFQEFTIPDFEDVNLEDYLPQ
ncbi:MAG: hypothetical protein R3313_03600 [Candidatus Saccharimonadales bacterium]|nr:hypothetical protein [Candidatus Saccharimonadales bacterium]